MEFNATFIVSLISFCVFIFIMNSILYRPISNIILKRKEYIDGNYKTASENASQKESILEKRDNEIKEARNSARSKIVSKKEELKEQKNKAVLNAETAAKKEIEFVANSLQQEQNEAHGELKHQIVNLAQMISDKFITTDEKINSDDELIAKILQG